MCFLFSLFGQKFTILSTYLSFIPISSSEIFIIYLSSIFREKFRLHHTRISTTLLSDLNMY